MIPIMTDRMKVSTWLLFLAVDLQMYDAMILFSRRTCNFNASEKP